MSPLVEAVALALCGADNGAPACACGHIGPSCRARADVAVRAVIDFVKEPTLHQRLYALLTADDA